MPRNTRGGRNNNPSGRNQYSNGWIDTAMERPVATAAAAAAAVGAGVFLWSRRNQISDQISSLSDQFGEWTHNMGSRGSQSDFDDDTAGLTTGMSNSKTSRGRNATVGMSETGGGNASLGAHSGSGAGSATSRRKGSRATNM
jgi:hypothetical protein